MTVTIVRAELADLERLAPLFDGYRQFYRQPSEPARVRAFLADRLRNGDSVVVLALDPERGTGLGFTQLYPTFSSVSIGRAFVLNDLFVAPEGRGRGIGAALLEHAARYGRETGALYLELETAVSNTPAQRLYERQGWVRETVFHKYALELRGGP
jgi:GNAT superfamily N-acetyltransferase